MIALYFILASLRLAPVYTDEGLSRRFELAQAAVEAGATKYEMQWLAAIAFRESTYRLDVVGDNGSSYCAYQIHLPRSARTRDGSTGPELLADAGACTREALRQLRASLHVCKHLPESERMALYARGRCDSETGRRLSRDRWSQVQKAKVGP